MVRLFRWLLVWGFFYSLSAPTLTAFMPRSFVAPAVRGTCQTEALGARLAASTFTGNHRRSKGPPPFDSTWRLLLPLRSPSYVPSGHYELFGLNRADRIIEMLSRMLHHNDRFYDLSAATKDVFLHRESHLIPSTIHVATDVDSV